MEMKKTNSNNKKVNLTSSNLSEEKLFELRRIIPEAFSEEKIDWEKLRTVLGDAVDARIEKFGFTWAGKNNAIKNVLIPSKATLVPAPDEGIKFDESQNLFIEGDNLEVLKLLQKAYFEKVKMIYIDPPYNTGGDFVYKDNFAAPVKNYLEQTGQVDSDGNRLSTNKEANGRFHSDWLSMMYPRLKLAWNLLRDDGVIFVSIDDHEAAHLRLLLNEIFGEECYLNTFVWVNNLKGRQIAGSGAAKTYEFVYAYAKNIEQVEGFEAPIEYLKSLMPSSYKGFDYELESDEDGEFVVKNELYNTNSAFNEETRPNLVFNIFYNPKTKEVRFTNIDEADIRENGFVKIPPRKNNDGVHRFHAWRWSRQKIENETNDLKFVESDGGMKVFTKIREHANTNLKDIISDISTTVGGSEVKNIFDGKKYFDYPKPIDLIRLFVSQTQEDDVILDFFAGSGTTAHAVMAQNAQDNSNRKWICVQLPEKTDESSEAYKAGFKTIASLAIERIRRAVKELGNNDGFKVFKLAESNYPENTFEFDPDKTEAENKAAFEDYLTQAKRAKLIDDIDETSIIYENIVKEGFSLNSNIAVGTKGNNKVYTITDGERQFSICLDREIDGTTVKNITEWAKGATFICFDNALNDSAKANLGLHVELKTI
jgi:adenine-specific DNA-methyltransferase